MHSIHFLPSLNVSLDSFMGDSWIYEVLGTEFSLISKFYFGMANHDYDWILKSWNGCSLSFLEPPIMNKQILESWKEWFMLDLETTKHDYDWFFVFGMNCLVSTLEWLLVVMKMSEDCSSLDDNMLEVYIEPLPYLLPFLCVWRCNTTGQGWRTIK